MADKVTNAFEIPCDECHGSHGTHRAGCSKSVHHNRTKHFTTQDDEVVKLRDLHDAPAAVVADPAAGES